MRELVQQRELEIPHHEVHAVGIQRRGSFLRVGCARDEQEECGGKAEASNEWTHSPSRPQMPLRDPG